MGDNTFLTRYGNGSHSKDPASGHNGLASIGSQQERARQTVEVLFGGEGAKLTANRSIDLDNVYGSAPHSSLGLQVAIAGRATVVQADVAAHLLEHQDPIRSILGVSIADSHRVIIKRRFVCVLGSRFWPLLRLQLTPTPTAGWAGTPRSFPNAHQDALFP